MKKILAIGLVIITLLFAGLKWLRPIAIEKAFKARVTHLMSNADSTPLEDGLHIYICGAGSPLADPKRGGPCLAIRAGERAFIFDAGTGGSRNLAQMRFPLGQVETIFLTHLHSDHMDGLGEMLMQVWVNGDRSAPLPVMGPIGTAQVVDGFNQAYELDQGYRVAHHGADIINPAGAGGIAKEISLDTLQTRIVDEDDLKITAYKVTHEPISPAFGYRIDYKDRSISISGDTSFDPNIAKVSQDVDVLLHEALNVEMVQIMRDSASEVGQSRLAKIFDDITNYHATPVEAARTAKSAKAKALVLTHIVPMLPTDALIPMFLKGTEEVYEGPITVSEDGMIIRLPTRSETIIYENKL